MNREALTRRVDVRAMRAQRSRCPTRGLLALALLLAAPAAAWAHPVILITFKIDFRFTATGLAGFTETWHFDDVHSAQILQMFDANHNGQIDPSELGALERGYFDDLKDYSYFTSVVVDGQERPTKSVEDFSATYSGRSMIYRFFVPLVVGATAAQHEVDVTIWDPTYFTDLSVEGSNAVSADAPSSIKTTVFTANDHRHFYNLAQDLALIKTPPFYLRMQVLRFSLAQ